MDVFKCLILNTYTNFVTIFISSIIALLFFLLIKSTRKPKLFPPGPSWLPVIGCLLDLKPVYKEKKYLHLVLNHFHEKYGSVLGLKLGRDQIVSVSGYEAVKYVMTSDSLEGRPDGFFFRFRSFGERLGIVFVDGPFMHEQRKFCINQMRSFGFGKTRMHEIITNEARELTAWIVAEKEEPICVRSLFDIGLLNAFWTMIAGQRFALNDERLQKLLNLVHAAFHLVDVSGGLLNQMPVLRFIAPNLTGFKPISMIIDELMDFFQKTVDDHRDDAQRNDFIGVFMEEIQKNKHKKENTSFTEKQLLIVLEDLFMAGTETTGSTLSFAIMYLLKYPEVQQKIHDELDVVVGEDQTPTMEHKLIYLEAFIMEVQRHANPVSVAIPHRALRDTDFMGYRIPEGTTILPSIWSIHMDEDHWHQPHLFKPERFISEDNEIIQSNYFMPFGVGRRKCIGEVLAKTSLFLFLSNILQKFKVEPAGFKLPTEILNGVTLVPAPYEAKFVPRI